MNINKTNFEVINDSIAIQNLKGELNLLSEKLENITIDIDNTETDELLGIPVIFWKVFIAIFIPILIFGLGNLAAWFKKKSEKRSLINSKIKAILSWIDLMGKPIELQTTSVDEYCKKIKEIKIIHPVEIEFYNILANKLNTSNLFEFTEIFLSNLTGDPKQKRKDLFNLISQIDLLIDLENKLRDTYEKQKEEILSLMLRWNNELKEINTSVLGDRENTETDNSLFKEYQKLVQNLNDNFPDRTNELELIVDNIINPFREFAKTKPENIYSNRLIITLTELLFISKQFLSNKSGYSYQIKRIIDETNNCYRILVNSAINIQKRKVVNVWRIK